MGDGLLVTALNDRRDAINQLLEVVMVEMAVGVGCASSGAR